MIFKAGFYHKVFISYNSLAAFLYILVDSGSYTCRNRGSEAGLLFRIGNPERKIIDIGLNVKPRHALCRPARGNHGICLKSQFPADLNTLIERKGNSFHDGS